LIELNVSRNGKKTEDWLRKISRGDILAELSRFGQEGVAVLSRATPVDTGLASQSWGYRIVKQKRGYSIEWFNTDRIDGTGPPVVILIQYGHATGNGAYIQGRDFINPAIRPLFDKICDEIWKKVKNG
jgi:hypothetical protein